LDAPEQCLWFDTSLVHDRRKVSPVGKGMADGSASFLDCALSMQMRHYYKSPQLQTFFPCAVVRVVVVTLIIRHDAELHHRKKVKEQ
jgi:hypothetical protein